MNSKLLIGSIVYGAAGIGARVLAIEGDRLTVETPKGTRTISSSKVVKVIPPRPKAFKLGDRVEYIGSDFNLKKQYAGTLEIWEMGKFCNLNKCACLKPNGRVTSWIEFDDLALVAEVIEASPKATELEGDLWS